MKEIFHLQGLHTSTFYWGATIIVKYFLKLHFVLNFLYY
jgi:hypothetical protein